MSTEPLPTGPIKHVATLTLAVEPDTEILGLITMQFRGGVLTAVSQPIRGQKMPAPTPRLLRWLADALEIDALAEVTDG